MNQQCDSIIKMILPLKLYILPIFYNKKSQRHKVPSIFFNPAEFSRFLFFHEAFEVVDTLSGPNETMHEIFAI